ncbi:MAG: proline dehydrogenase [Myxococcota bacterium]
MSRHGSDDDDEARRARVISLLTVARDWADRSHPRGRDLRVALRAHSPLSAEGRELALQRHLETIDRVSPDELDRFLARGRAHRADEVHVLLAGNVGTAALRAIAFALACAPRVTVRPSRRDPALARAIAAVVPEVHLVSCLTPAATHGVHLYGGDTTLDDLRRLPGRHLHFGSGFGVAVLSDDRGRRDANAVAEDLVAFDGAGCISPRVILAREPFAALERLHAALSASAVPRGPLTDHDRVALARARTTLQVVGTWREGPHHALGLDPTPTAPFLLPALRTALVLPLEVADASWFSHRKLTVIGGHGPTADALAAAAPHARRLRLGTMQRPPFDGPVDLRPFPVVVDAPTPRP